jgi:hypothetical protein
MSAANANGRPSLPCPNVRQFLQSRQLQRQSHLKTGSAGLGFKRNLAAMTAHDPIDGVQTYSCSITDGLRGEEWLEEMRFHRIGNSRTIVDDLNENEVEFSGSSNNQLALTSHGINGIVNEVGPDLIQLAAMREYPGKFGVELPLHFHAAL